MCGEIKSKYIYMAATAGNSNRSRTDRSNSQHNRDKNGWKSRLSVVSVRAVTIARFTYYYFPSIVPAS